MCFAREHTTPPSSWSKSRYQMGDTAIQNKFLCKHESKYSLFEVLQARNQLDLGSIGKLTQPQGTVLPYRVPLPIGHCAPPRFSILVILYDFVPELRSQKAKASQKMKDGMKGGVDKHPEGLESALVRSGACGGMRDKISSGGSRSDSLTAHLIII
ncbi:hypothetical protein K438DRAFT_1782074 [Mycena galopus ATCC 62051]|nr:hypothetical protein K438DRAFT_1782074 [Mycena galopus ATCC 62051]